MFENKFQLKVMTKPTLVLLINNNLYSEYTSKTPIILSKN